MGAWLAGPQASIVQELSFLSARDWTLATLVGLGVAMIFLGWLVPYRLVRRKDYDRLMELHEAAQRTNAQNADSIKKIADSKDLATSIVAELRKNAVTTTHRGAVHEEQP